MPTPTQSMHKTAAQVITNCAFMLTDADAVNTSMSGRGQLRRG